MDTLIQFTYSTLLQHIELLDELPTLARDDKGPEFWELVHTRLEPQSLMIWVDQLALGAGIILQDQHVFFKPLSVSYLFVAEQKKRTKDSWVGLGVKLKDPAFTEKYLLAKERPYSERGLTYFQKVGEKLADLLMLPMEWEDMS
ncbi:MAG: hypothetical protein AAFQ83_00040 [Bacteroidota bacterium]